jgi:signal transduction histidine kinase
VLRQIVDSRRTDLERKNLQVELAVDGNAETRAPHTVLSTVLGNLLDAAIEGSGDRKIVVALDKEGVTIADTAIGNALHEKSYILDDSSDPRVPTDDGVGRGHTIVKRLCERYGWRIEIRRSEEFGKKARLVLAD